MTDGPLQSAGAAGQAVVGDALTRARRAILWERLWPALVSLLTAVGLFIALSWLGLWLWLPPVGRIVGLVALIALTAYASLPLLRLRIPTRQEGLQRLDRMSGLPHRPATAVTDEMATTAGDAFSMALWRAHLARALDAARSLNPGRPVPELAARDPYALRGLVLVLLFATFFAADGERLRRIAAAFDFRGVVTPANFRVDAWVTPPLYTGKSPLLLPGVRPGEPVQTAANYSVPVGSILVVRASGKSGLDIDAKGELSEVSDGPAPPAGTEERRFVINGGGSATIHSSADDVTWSFTAIADRAPTITLAKDPESQPRGAMVLNYKVEDDYGVAEAKAVFSRAEKPSTSNQKVRPLYDPPEFPLVLPQARARNGVGQTVKDVTEHPLAGADVAMTLIARDQAGNEGRSEAFKMKLPERPFFNLLAKSLVELRRMLALNAEEQPRVLIALDALSIAPERFTKEIGVYLGLQSIYWSLNYAKTDDQLRDVVSRMWAFAVLLEDGSLGDAAAALRAAEEALRQALERNASDEEIKRLTDQLRAAINNYLQALARELRKNPEQLARPLAPDSQMLNSQDLQNLLSQLENLSRSGNKEAARQLLRQLQAMLDNLQMARPDGSRGNGDMRLLGDLAEMIQRQQRLRDRTYQQGQDMRRDGQNGQNQMGELQDDQQGLRDKLNKMLDELRQRGYGMKSPDQQGQDGQQGSELDQLGRAGDAMGDAEGALGGGNPDSAVDSQGRALEALRRGAQNLAQAMQQRRGVGQGPGLGGRLGQARGDDETDPLGRPRGNRDFDDTSVKVPGEIDVQRARRILEELRRRFGDAGRPQLELDYIERLLKDF